VPLRKHIFSPFVVTAYSHPVVTCSERQTDLKMKHSCTACVNCRLYVEDP